VWGYHWKGYDKYHGLIHGNKSLKEMHRMCHIFNESKINLNIHYTHSRQSVNLRTFEIPSTRSFQLCDDFSEMKNLFSKKELVTYQDEKDLLELIDYYRDNIEERSRFADAGHRRVMKDHTFKNRMQDILSKF
ncbi:MAG: glycosyltransferase, partial [Candidatus Woesearchaeota archaeon]|nr:glycosyltransferase [Candidatus Woesearchaeota archaeon]